MLLQMMVRAVSFQDARIHQLLIMMLLFVMMIIHVFRLCYGCTDTSAVNYTANANTDDGSCCFLSGCTDSSAFNYDATVCYDDGSCIGLELGCTDILAMNFDSTANTSNGSCIYLVIK